MKNMTIRAGARLNFSIDRADDTAVSATFIAETPTNVITDTINYDSEGVAYFEFGSPDTDVPGVYKYQVNENFATGSPDKYPVTKCDDELPELRILDSLDGVIDSA